MSRRALAATLTMVGLGSFCLLPFGGKPTDAQVPPQATPALGRYQITTNDHTLIMVDTTNGRCWRALLSHTPLRWIELGSPLDQPAAQ